MSKGTNTSATIPDWAKPYALKAMQSAGNVSDYFWGGLQDWRNGGSGTELPGAGGPGGKAREPVFEAVGPSNAPRLPDTGGDGITGPGGLGGVLTPPAGGVDPSIPPTGDPGTIGTGTVRRKLTGTGTVAPQPDVGDPVGAPGYFYDPSILLGYSPQDVPDLSAAEQEWGSLIPQLLQQPADEQTAKDWASSALTEAGRVPTLSVGDVLGGPPSAAGAASMTATTLPATQGAATSTPAAGDWISDPTIRAAKEIFDKTGSEQIKNAMTQAGLGRSTAVGDALAKGWGEQLMPLINQQLNFQNEAINRQQAARNTGISTNLETGARSTSRLLSSLGQLKDYGGTARSVAQQKSDAKEKERLRLQALGEEALFPYASGTTALGSTTRKA